MTEAKTYPKISRKMWSLVRDRFKKSIPSAVTPTFIRSLSEMEDNSARSNVIAPLRELKILDEEGKPTQLATRWRDDEDYEKVCDEILKQVYPNELLEAFPKGHPPNEQAIRNWFMKVGHVGEAAAKMYAKTFAMLVEGDSTKLNEKPTRETVPIRRVSVQRSATKPVAAKTHETKNVVQPLSESSESKSKGWPSIHVDLQIHISPDASPEQIDRIFASMAKHLGNRNA